MTTNILYDSLNRLILSSKLVYLGIYVRVLEFPQVNIIYQYYTVVGLIILSLSLFPRLYMNISFDFDIKYIKRYYMNCQNPIYRMELSVNGENKSFLEETWIIQDSVLCIWNGGSNWVTPNTCINIVKSCSLRHLRVSMNSWWRVNHFSLYSRKV